MSTTNDINALITTALKDVISQAVAQQIEARIEALDVDVASALVYFNRKHKDLEAINAQLRAQLAALETRVNRLEADKTDRAFEREDTISDMVETCVNEAFKDIDLSDQVRNVLADARICI